MPRAVRKDLTGAKQVDPATFGGLAVGSKIAVRTPSDFSVSTRKQTRVVDGVVTMEASEMRMAAGLWHALINRVSGGLALSYGKKGVKKEELRDWVGKLRQVADGMEKFL